jgi:DNA polymerase zeta
MQDQKEKIGFALRIVSVDYYLTKPKKDFDVCYSNFGGYAIAKIPVVRIFGRTIAGQSVCLHLHKAFPYFFVPFNDELPATPEFGILSHFF